ncbi:DNA adenine methylase [Agrobacterium vitis]|nr:DNA adenine methylase [Agrobacterium vitis]MBE1437054.1 DNA adenine methylase [Agrobacterium vitis]
MSKIFKANKLQQYHYAEPYAGGCGLALSLLFSGYVSDIHVNDIDPSIWSFWYSVLNHTEELVRLVEFTDVSVQEWHRQKAIQIVEDLGDPLALGFSAFFLNRTNRSGIITGAGVIGGLQQVGNYKIDCRFNKDDLIRRIRRISKYRSRIHLTRKDAVEFMGQSQSMSEDTFFCIDPPYFNKGSSLYTSFYVPDDHEVVAGAVMKLTHPWVVTYDNAEQIRALYRQRRQFIFDINYSVQTKRVGTELLIASKGLRLPSEITERQVNRVQYRVA